MSKLTKCRICKNKDLIKIFSLGSQPLANNLLDKPQEVKKYPLNLVQCSHCSLIQLDYVVDRRKMYTNYLYIPSVSKTHLQHFEKLAGLLILELSLRSKSLVVDIGSNDGSLLKYFQKYGMRVIGVEPARNIKADVPTVREFFKKSIAKQIVNSEGKAKLITATNVFAHIDDLHYFLEALDTLLDDDGVFFAQFPDIRNLLKENQFDTIYHEHLSYFKHESLSHLFTNTPFEIFRIDTTPVHGGSMQIYVRRREPLIENFDFGVQTIKNDLYLLLSNFKKEGKKIVGFGAAAKGMVLLDYCGLDNQLIDYIADGTPYKQGKYTPGTNIPILPEEELTKNKPDIILILAWNFKEEIMEKLEKRGFTFVVPIPTVQIIQ